LGSGGSAGQGGDPQEGVKLGGRRGGSEGERGRRGGGGRMNGMGGLEQNEGGDVLSGRKDGVRKFKINSLRTL